MKSLDLYFVGVGAATDSARANTSILLVPKEEGEVVGTVLIDCGLNVPYSLDGLFAKFPQLDISMVTDVLITHGDDDHRGGVGLFMLKHFEDMKKKGAIGRDVGFYSSLRMGSSIDRRIREGYAGVVKEMPDISLSWETQYVPDGVMLHGMAIAPVKMRHTVATRGYRIEYGDFTVLAGWDGSLVHPTSLIGVDLWVQDTYFMAGEGNKAHPSAETVIRSAQKYGVPNLAMVHISSDEYQDRDRFSSVISQASAAGIELCIPKQYDRFIF
ncbi:MAG: MBL fold metallo-hydrolase [Candidatus Woesearchaeota archaeon]|nr:MBL fold metallo-hydrolase [Candidatus Woesearchaeota archaeon]